VNIEIIFKDSAQGKVAGEIGRMILRDISIAKKDRRSERDTFGFRCAEPGEMSHDATLTIWMAKGEIYASSTSPVKVAALRVLRPHLRGKTIRIRTIVEEERVIGK
jgi:hypothetical protein